MRCSALYPLWCPTNHSYTEAMGSVTSPFAVPGTYEIEYVMVDNQGNRGSRTRKLVVTAASSSSGLSPGGAAGVTIVLLLLIALAVSS